MISAWETIEWRPGATGIYGLDLMIDDNLNVWLIEVNKQPCMSYSTHVTQALVPPFMEDLAKLLIDRPNNPDCPIGNLEQILNKNPITEIK